MYIKIAYRIYQLVSQHFSKDLTRPQCKERSEEASQRIRFQLLKKNSNNKKKINKKKKKKEKKEIKKQATTTASTATI